MQIILLLVFTLVFISEIVVPFEIVNQNKDCFNHDVVGDNGITPREQFVKCGLTKTKTLHTNPEILKCAAQAFGMVNEDGSVNPEVVKSGLRLFAIPELSDKIVELGMKAIQLLPEKIYPYFIEGISLICPFDSFYGHL